MTEEQNLIQWIYSSNNEQELAERYDEWAKTYEGDLDRDFGWYGPLYAVEAFARFVPKGARVLDAGAGTGLVGKLLVEQGYDNLVAMDISNGMLEEARKKNAYKEFHQMVMGEKLAFPSDSFDAVVTVGVLTVGHAPASSLDELVRITSPGGQTSCLPFAPICTKRAVSRKSTPSWSPQANGSSAKQVNPSRFCQRASQTCSTRYGCSK